jgi:hypothetical protein
MQPEKTEMRWVSNIQGLDNVTLITAELWPEMIKMEGEIISVAYCVLRLRGKIWGKVVLTPKAYAVAAPAYIKSKN